MSRPTDWWVLDLSQDPTPGDPDAVRRLAKTFSDFAYDVASAERAIAGLGSNDVITEWIGDSGDAFRQEFTDFPPDLKKLHTSYDMCAQALETYAPKLEAAQRQADQALVNGRSARDDLQRAQSQLTGAQDWVKTANQQAQQYQNKPASAPKPDPAQVAAATRNAQAAGSAQAQAQGAVNAAQARLNAAKTLANQAEQSRLSAAHQCADDIGKASDAGIHNLSWWQRAFSWVADHWGQIISVLKVIAFVLAIVVLIVGGPLAWVLVGISAILTIDALVKAIQGKGSWWDVLFNALGCIPVTEGLTSISALRDVFAEGGLLGVGAHLLGAMKSTVTGLIEGLRGGGTLIMKTISEHGLEDLADVIGNPAFRAGDADRLAFSKAYSNYADDLQAIKDIMARDPSLAGMSPEDLTAVRGYTSNEFYSQMNAALRSGDPAALAQYDSFIRTTASGLNQLPNFVGDVSRGMTIGDPAALSSFVDSFKPGELRVDPQFLSTSTGAPFPGNIELTIASTTGKDIAALSHYPEGEVLFGPGSTFKVLDKMMDPSGTWHISLLDVSGR